uniref:Uncharacterized protein n=1 Tax=Arundo donax TaxID=35708 RepID=A0A0A9E1S2_ARUDO
MSSLERVIKPNIALLRQCGLSVRDIVQMCSRHARVLVYNQESLKAFVLRAEELGVPRSSRMFKHALSAVACASEKKVAAKLEFLKMTLGCSKTEAAIAVSKVPSILGFSDDCLLPKIEFLINEVGMEPQYIVERPVLFTLSLGKRLVPRHSVMKVLQAKGLLKCNMKFCALSTIGEATFKLKFIDRHKDSVTGLADAYASARAGGVPPEVQL